MTARTDVEEPKQRASKELSWAPRRAPERREIEDPRTAKETTLSRAHEPEAKAPNTETAEPTRAK